MVAVINYSSINFLSLLSDNSAWTVLVNQVNGQLVHNEQVLLMITWTRQHSADKVFQDAYRVTKFLEFSSNSQKPKQIDIEFWGPSSTYPSGIECETEAIPWNAEC